MRLQEKVWCSVNFFFDPFCLCKKDVIRNLYFRLVSKSDKKQQKVLKISGSFIWLGIQVLVINRNKHGGYVAGSKSIQGNPKTDVFSIRLEKL